MAAKKTVLQIVQACAYRGNTPAPATLYANTDGDALQLVNLLYEVCEDIRRGATFPQQKKVFSFDLETSRSLYPFPVDYWSQVRGTQYDLDATRRLNGPMQDASFALMKYENLGLSSSVAYRAFGPDGNNYTAGGQLEVYPTPTASGETLGFEYISSNLFMPKYWQISTAYTIGQYVSSNGKIYLCDTSGTSSATTAVAGTAANTVDATTRWDYQNITYETILADTDLCVFDDDLVTKGLQGYYLTRRNIEGGAELVADFKKAIKAAKARWNGSVMGSMARVQSSPNPHGATDGNWPL